MWSEVQTVDISEALDISGLDEVVEDNQIIYQDPQTGEKVGSWDNDNQRIAWKSNTFLTRWGVLTTPVSPERAEQIFEDSVLNGKPEIAFPLQTSHNGGQFILSKTNSGFPSMCLTGFTADDNFLSPIAGSVKIQSGTDANNNPTSRVIRITTLQGTEIRIYVPPDMDTSVIPPEVNVGQFLFHPSSVFQHRYFVLGAGFGSVPHPQVIITMTQKGAGNFNRDPQGTFTFIQK